MTHVWLRQRIWMVWVLAGALGWIAGPQAHADQWVKPLTTVVTSPDGACKASIEPGNAQPADKGGSPAKLTRSGTCGEGSFALRSEWMPVGVVVLDDGSVVTFDQWHSLGYGEVAIFYAPDGTVRWSKTLVQLLGQEALDRAPHSVSSIWWRKTPLEWSLTDNTLLITLHNEDKLSVDLSTGDTKAVAVTDLGNDPERLIRRAEALSQAGTWAEAVPLLETAIKHTPKLRPRVMLGDALRESGQAAQAVTVLQNALAALDRKEIQPEYPESEGNEVANLTVSLARAQELLGDDEGALVSLRRGIAAYPDYMYPVQQATNILHRLGRTAERDALLLAHLTHGLSSSQTYIQAQAASEVGDAFRQWNEPKKALDAYLKGYKSTEVTSMFLYASLAELHEAQGQTAEAIAIHKQLIAHYKTLHPTAFADHIARSEEALGRLKP